MFILQSDKSKNKSFTLLEIVFTIVIIGILLAIFLPVMSSVKLAAQKVKDQSNLKIIAAAWRECAINRGWVINGVDAGRHWVVVFAEQLAGRGKTDVSNIVLNTSSLYISPGDKYASKIENESLCDIKNGIITNSANCYSFVSNFMIFSQVLISYCLVMGLPVYAPLETTPLGFTRGLRKDGKWDEKAGLYGSKGGYVVYCDGHVVWFDGSRPAKFLKWDQSGYTSDIREAVPDSVFISCCNGNGTIDYKSDGKSADQLVILYHAGTGGN